jgi:prophage endopeptidase
MNPAVARGLGLLAVVAVIFATGFLFGWKWQAVEYAEFREDGLTDALVDMAHAQVQRNKLQKDFEALDARHTEAKRNAEEREAKLLSDVGAGRIRLSVLASQCRSNSETGATGLDDGRVRADLDPAHGERVIRITREGDRAIRALSALQEYVRRVCLSNG